MSDSSKEPRGDDLMPMNALSAWLRLIGPILVRLPLRIQLMATLGVTMKVSYGNEALLGKFSPLVFLEIKLFAQRMYLKISVDVYFGIHPLKNWDSCIKMFSARCFEKICSLHTQWSLISVCDKLHRWWHHSTLWNINVHVAHGYFGWLWIELEQEMFVDTCFWDRNVQVHTTGRVLTLKMPLNPTRRMKL